MRCSVRAIATFLVLVLFLCVSTIAGDYRSLCSEQKTARGEMNDILKQLSISSTLDSSMMNYDVYQYDVALKVDEINEMLDGGVTFYVEIVEPLVDEIQFELYNNMIIDSVVHENGAHMSLVRYIHMLTMTLDRTYDVGERFSFTVYYNGSPVDLMWHGFFFESYGSIPVMGTQSQPHFSQSWWPCKDRVYDKADSMRIAITAANHLTVSSNGVLDSIIPNPDGTNTTYWRETYPITPTQFTINISIFRLWFDEWVYNDSKDTMPIYNYVLEPFLEMSEDSLAQAPQLLTWMSKYFGNYPFAHEKYGHSMFSTSAWALEHQTNISIYVGAWGMVDYIIVHEMAHQWWGDALTCNSWGHAWINEGWGTYAEALVEYERRGWAGYHDKMGEFLDNIEWWGRASIRPDDTVSDSETFDIIIYHKGAWVAHMLRRFIGDDMFFGALDSLFKSEYMYGMIDTEQFSAFFSDFSGHDLTEFFNDWVYGDYQPNYTYSYLQEQNDSGWYDIYIAVDQIQTSDPMVFDNMIDFGLMYSGATEYDTVQFLNTQRKQVFKYCASDSLVHLTLDPGNWLLKYAAITNWTFRVVTEQADLGMVRQYQSYLDTIIGVSSDNTTIYTLAGGMPAGIHLEDNGVISGSTVDTPGGYWFKIQFIDNYTGQYQIKEYILTVLEGQGVAGDVDGNNQLDVSDLLYMVDHFFADPPGPPPSNPVLADVNADCQMDISDLLYLVDFFFAEPAGPAPQVGCAN